MSSSLLALRLPSVLAGGGEEKKRPILRMLLPRYSIVMAASDLTVEKRRFNSQEQAHEGVEVTGTEYGTR